MSENSFSVQVQTTRSTATAEAPSKHVLSADKTCSGWMTLKVIQTHRNCCYSISCASLPSRVTKSLLCTISHFLLLLHCKHVSNCTLFGRYICYLPISQNLNTPGIPYWGNLLCTNYYSVGSTCIPNVKIEISSSFAHSQNMTESQSLEMHQVTMTTSHRWDQKDINMLTCFWSLICNF